MGRNWSARQVCQKKGCEHLKQEMHSSDEWGAWSSQVQSTIVGQINIIIKTNTICNLYKYNLEFIQMKSAIHANAMYLGI